MVTLKMLFEDIHIDQCFWIGRCKVEKQCVVLMQVLPARGRYSRLVELKGWEMPPKWFSK